MKVDKRMREQAANLCALMASSNRMADGEFLIGMDLAADHEIDFKEPCSIVGVACMSQNGAAELARAALCSVPVAANIREAWAEAESMLRSGWSPR